MNARRLAAMAGRLGKSLALVFGGLGRKERVDAPGIDLCGLSLGGELKSLDPIAQRLVRSADEAEAMRQRLQQAVTVVASDEGPLARDLVDALLVTCADSLPLSVRGDSANVNRCAHSFWC